MSKIIDVPGDGRLKLAKDFEAIFFVDKATATVKGEPGVNNANAKEGQVVIFDNGVEVFREEASNISDPTATDLDALVSTVQGYIDGTPIALSASVTGASTSTALSAYDFAGGTTIMNGMTIQDVPIGSYLLFFGTNVDHNTVDEEIKAAIEIDGVQIAETQFQRGGAGADVRGSISFVGFPITLTAIKNVNIHWIEDAGGNANAYDRNLSLIKVL